MKINTARKIDYFVGIPLCFFFSIIENIKKYLFSKSIIKILPKKIVFLEFSEIGSAILAYPLVERMKEKYPDAEIYFWIFKENSEILNLFDLIPEKNIIVMRSKSIITLFIDTLKNMRRIRKEEIDTLIDLELFSRFSSILGYLSGARVRVGFYKYKLEGLYRGNLHTHGVMYNPYFHISRNFSFFVDSLDVSTEDAPLVKRQQEESGYFLPKITTGSRGLETIRDKLKIINGRLEGSSKIIVINFGIDNKISIRQWPVRYYLELAGKILEKQDVFIVFTGVGLTNAISFLPKHERCINLVEKITIKELVGLFNISKILISHDSGIIHMASLTDIHIIALFGPETPLLYGPLTKNKKVFYKSFTCSPCLSAYNHRNSICRDNKCMQAITVDEVYNEVIRIIE